MEDEAREVMFPMGQKAPTGAGKNDRHSRVFVPGLCATSLRVSELQASAVNTWLWTEGRLGNSCKILEPKWLNEEHLIDLAFINSRGEAFKLLGCMMHADLRMNDCKDQFS